MPVPPWCSIQPVHMYNGLMVRVRIFTAEETNSSCLSKKEVCRQHSQTVAAIGKSSADVAVEDPDAEAVRDYFMRHGDSESESERREIEPDGDEQNAGADDEHLDLEQQAVEPQPPEPSTLTCPTEPTEDEKQRHCLTHVPFAPWCEQCVAGAGSKPTREDGQLETVVQADYTFFSRSAQQTLVEDESTPVTVLTFVGKTSGWPLSFQITKKGDCSQYVLNTVEQYLRTLGHERTIIQIDQENSIRTVAKAIQKRLGDKRVQIREAPIHSHQSQGSVESEHGKIAGLVRTILLDLQLNYWSCPVNLNHLAFPWLVRHAAWLTARFQPLTKDHATPYRIVNVVDYMSPVFQFGETVMARLPQPGTKTQRRWVKGIWVGRLERDDTHIILTAAGALSVRSVRRLPPSSQWQVATLSTVTGLPWQPK